MAEDVVEGWEPRYLGAWSSPGRVYRLLGRERDGLFVTATGETYLLAEVFKTVEGARSAAVRENTERTKEACAELDRCVKRTLDWQKATIEVVDV